MPSFLAVFEDTAPFFTYKGDWAAGSSHDVAAELYSESSFSVTTSRGASLSFPFYGTEFSIIGAKRQNHGLYQVILDGVSSPPISGSVAIEQFRAILYTAKREKGLHNVTLENLEDKFLDVDMVSWVASVGDENEQLVVNTWQDTHPAFVYSPQDAWSTSPPLQGLLSGSTGHGTSKAGATAQLTFKGGAIAIYGPSGPTGPISYSVQVDNGILSLYTGRQTFQRAKQLLYYEGNLGVGEHTLTLKLVSSSDSQPQVLAVDYAEIYTTPSLGGSFESETPLGFDPQPEKCDAASGSPPTGLIIGIALCGAVAALSLGLIFYVFLLYKRGRLIFAAPQGRDAGVPTADNLGPGYLTTPLTYPDSQSTSSATTSTYPSRGREHVFSARSVRKSRLIPTNGSDRALEAAAAPSIPPPAYT